jgi:hypothetical protein
VNEASKQWLHIQVTIFTLDLSDDVVEVKVNVGSELGLIIWHKDAG